MTPEQRERYARHILLREVGGQGQQKLMDARVLVIGAGGLGSPILQYLAGAGVGTLGISDSDDVSLSNLQRQVMFRTEDVGADKTKSAAAYIERLNPNITVKTHPRISDENASAIIADYDLVVEGVDNFAARYVLNRACLTAKKPLVSAAVGRFEGQLSTFKPYDNPGVLPCYRCLVPEEPPRDQQVNCAEEGVLGAVTGVLGTLAAMEVLKELLSVGDSMAGRLLVYDGLAGTFRTIRLPADPACSDCGRVAD
ncbi:molybdopterin-synthase adenylyltransferase MoeB [Hyphococcus flavus]|uniref:Molybdopterin-synthase adenylyltransferase n=1 Tax=Hyphococcus flavus TaxID=1866326 RepID=A0AAE9ZGL3_9PROT|nr:molybdopterin-synthase adenylyltransferase MoeB [Hyphococcus flavus]WDI32628.1 molybdopterin-synthase adenylyltransferase MoeB [Hyphococcus flavus]